jgi:hypothetical protein
VVQHTLGKQMVRSPEADTTLAETAANQELERLVGRYGRISALRPSGIAEFDGHAWTSSRKG